MGKEFDKERLKQVYDFIFRISKGDFTYKLNPTSYHDELETIVLLLNMMKEELNMLVHQFDPQESFVTTISLTILFDSDYRILGFSDNLAEIFENTDNIIGEKLKKYIDNETYKKIKLLKKDLTNLDQQMLDCNLYTNNNLLINMQGIFQAFIFEKELKTYYLLNLFKTEHRNHLLERKLKENAIINYKKYSYPTKVRTLLLKDRRQVIRNLHTYLMNHLDSPLPSMKELAMEIGASESKLKKGFKKMFGTSIFKYHKEQRFEQAIILLQNTEKPVGTIALECGFLSPAHFSRAFKSRFGFRPSDIRTSKLTP